MIKVTKAPDNQQLNVLDDASQARVLESRCYKLSTLSAWRGHWLDSVEKTDNNSTTVDLARKFQKTTGPAT